MLYDVCGGESSDELHEIIYLFLAFLPYKLDDVREKLGNGEALSVKKAPIDRSRPKFLGPQETYWRVGNARGGLFTLDGENMSIFSQLRVGPVLLERRAIAVLRSLGSAVNIS